MTQRRRLLSLLVAAHAGERAAALAYRGHHRSLPAGADRDAIRAIEAEEWHHRARLALWLERLGAKPWLPREWALAAIGGTLGPLCRISGWLAPMYGAGFLEAQNVNDYLVGAELARQLELSELADELQQFAVVEARHETYFRSRVLSHPLGPWLPRWRAEAARPSAILGDAAN